MHASISYLFFITILLFTITSGCGDNSTGTGTSETDYSTVPELADTTNATKVNVGELIYYVINDGEGHARVQNRELISAYFTFRSQDGTILSSTYVNGFTGSRDIPVSTYGPEGFRLGVTGMKENEHRVIVVPPELGYKDVPDTDPNYDLRNDTLYYDIEIDRIY